MAEELPEHGVTLQKEVISDFLSSDSLDSFVEVTVRWIKTSRLLFI